MKPFYVFNFLLEAGPRKRADYDNNILKSQKEYNLRTYIYEYVYTWMWPFPKKLELLSIGDAP